MARAVVSGYVSRDPESRTSNGGNRYLLFSVAERYYADREKRTRFWSVKYFGRGAEAISSFLKKGTAVTVIGEFDTRLREDGGEVYFNIFADNVSTFRVDQDGSSVAPPKKGGHGDNGHRKTVDTADDDDIPF